MKTVPITLAALAGAVATTVGISQALASPPARPAAGIPPQAAAGEITVTPQIINPGVGPRATNGATDDPNPCTFPIRTWAYIVHTPTPLANGDIRIHVIKAISYQPLDQARTIFETDDFSVLIHHTHPQSNWRITGRYGEWWLGGKKIWSEVGRFSASPTANGGEILHNPHPRGIAKQPSLCMSLHL
jgi:hypothetical protein